MGSAYAGSRQSYPKIPQNSGPGPAQDSSQHWQEEIDTNSRRVDLPVGTRPSHLQVMEPGAAKSTYYEHIHTCAASVTCTTSQRDDAMQVCSRNRPSGGQETPKKKNSRNLFAVCLCYEPHLSLEVALTSPPSQPHSAVWNAVKGAGVKRGQWKVRCCYVGAVHCETLCTLGGASIR